MNDQTSAEATPAEATTPIEQMGLNDLREAGKAAGISGAATMSQKELRRLLSEQAAKATDGTPAKPGVPYVSVKAERKARADVELDRWISGVGFEYEGSTLAATPERLEDLDLTTPQGRYTAKRRLAADKAIAKMRKDGKIQPAAAKDPVDPERSARAKKAWDTIRQRKAEQAAAAEAEAQ